MAKHPDKRDFPVSQIRRYLEPGPIVLVSSCRQDSNNVMTLGWHTVMEFTPSLVGCIISEGNHSFHMIRESRECVFNLPTTAQPVPNPPVVGTMVFLDNIERLKLEPERIMSVHALNPDRLTSVADIRASLGRK